MLLIKVLTILAYPKDKRLDYLTELGTLPFTDELEIQFDAIYKDYFKNKKS